MTTENSKPKQKSPHKARKWPLRWAARISLFGAMLVLSLAIYLALVAVRRPPVSSGAVQRQPSPSATFPPPTYTATRTPTPSPTITPTPGPPRVGLVAGHWKNDSGAICDDGLQEVQINLDVARRTAKLLKEAGYDVDVLAEFAPELNGYKAAAFVAIHSDSCLNLPEATGFKVAHVTNSAVPLEEDKLVSCLWSEYGKATGLAPHPGSITRDMRQYHAFRRIALKTPGAIIELGFMYNDREILTKHADVVARGVAAGIRCFLEKPAPLPNQN